MIHVLPHRLHWFLLLAFSYSKFGGSTMFQINWTGVTKDWESFEMLKKTLLGTSPYASIRLLNINGHGMSEYSSVLREDARSFLYCYAYTCSQRRWSLAPSLHFPPYVMQLQVLINSSLWLSVGHLLCLLDFVVCDVICCTPLDHISYVSYVLLQSCCATERQQTSVYFSGWMNTLFTRFVNNYPTSHSFMGTEIHYYYFFSSIYLGHYPYLELFQKEKIWKKKICL